MKLRANIKDMKTFISMFASLKHKSCHVMFSPTTLRCIARMTTTGGQFINATDGGIWATAVPTNIFEAYKIESNTDNTIIISVLDVSYLIHALRTLEKNCAPGTVMMKLALAKGATSEHKEILSMGGNVTAGKAAAGGQCDHSFSVPVTILGAQDLKMSVPPAMRPENFVCIDIAKVSSELSAIIERFRLCKIEAVTFEFGDIKIVDRNPQQLQQHQNPRAAIAGPPQEGLGKLSLIGRVEGMKMEMAIVNVPVDLSSMHNTFLQTKRAQAAKRRARMEEAAGGEGLGGGAAAAAAASPGEDDDADGGFVDMKKHLPLDEPRAFCVTVSLKRLVALTGIKDLAQEGNGGMTLFSGKGLALWSNTGKSYVIGMIAAFARGADEVDNVM